MRAPHHMYSEDANRGNLLIYRVVFCTGLPSTTSEKGFPEKKLETEADRGKMKMMQDEIRKGPWTEQEDIVLINFVHLFGDRRWDFIAKVSGLNRTGKSCRLRWVNYLHPGLKRGKMTPQEEKLVLELHDKWGNRWSRIARKLPGRTDNEIKNYWRTHMRKKAQENKRANSPSTQQRKRAVSPSLSSSASSSNVTTVNSSTFPETGEASFYDTGGPAMVVSGDKTKEAAQGGENGYSMDDIWKDIENTIEPVCDGFSEDGCNFPCPSLVSPPWEYGPDMLWRMDEEESKMFLPFEHGAMLTIG